MLHDLALPASRAALARAGGLVILAVGSAATAGAAAGDPAATYPARLQAALAAALPGAAIRVVNQATAQGDTPFMAEHLAGFVRDAGAALVIWATGTRDATRSADIDVYVAGLAKGITAIRAAGADVILMDMQYAPSIARILNFAPYREALRGIAVAREVPLLARHEFMQLWHSDGAMDLDARDGEERHRVARKLFACLAAALATPIAQALR